MPMTKVFKSGNSQAVRIPKEFKIDADEVEIVEFRGALLLRKPENNLGLAYDTLASMPKDFFKGGRRQPKVQKRKGL